MQFCDIIILNSMWITNIVKGNWNTPITIKVKEIILLSKHFSSTYQAKGILTLFSSLQSGMSDFGVCVSTYKWLVFYKKISDHVRGKKVIPKHRWLHPLIFVKLVYVEPLRQAVCWKDMCNINNTRLIKFVLFKRQNYDTNKINFG